MTLREVIGQVLDERPVVSIGIVEIDPLPIAVHILDRGFCVVGSTEPSTNPFDIFNLITTMVEARSPRVWRPDAGLLLIGRPDAYVRFFSTNVQPSSTIRID